MYICIYLYIFIIYYSGKRRYQIMKFALCPFHQIIITFPLSYFQLIFCLRPILQIT